MRAETLDREQAENLAEALTSLAGVADLYGGQFGEVALLFPGGRVHGLRYQSASNEQEPDHLQVMVVVEGKEMPNLDKLADQVRATVADFSDAPVDVIFSDVA